MVRPAARSRPTSLSPAAQEKLCRGFLPVAQKILRRALGPEAVEVAGLALLETVRAFDPSRRVPFTAFARQRLVWAARRELRRNNPWPASSAGAVLPLEDFDQPGRTVGSDELLRRDAEPDADLVYRDELLHALRTIERLEDPARLVGLGKLLGGFSTPQIARMIAIGPHNARAQLRLVRQSLHAS